MLDAKIGAFDDFVSVCLVIFYKRVPYSQRYLFNANPGANHNANPTNPTTKYRCE